MIDEATLAPAEEFFVSGCLGHLFDETPRVTLGRVRPFIWSYLLLRGGVRRHEVVGCLPGHVSGDDTRIADDDPLERTRLELVVDEALAELVAEGLLRCREDGLYVLMGTGLKRAMSLVCLLNAQLPDHLLHEIR